MDLIEKIKSPFNGFLEGLLNTSFEFIDRLGEKIYEKTWLGRLEKELQKKGYKTNHNQIYIPPINLLDKPRYMDIIEILTENEKIVVLPFPEFNRYFDIVRATYDYDRRIVLTNCERKDVYSMHIVVKNFSTDFSFIAEEIHKKIKRR